MTPRDPWDSFLDPRVVCVVGASGDRDRIGGRLVRYSLESGFTGRVIPVNPNRDTVFGLPTRPSLAAVDEAPDWVVVALPRERVPDTVEAAGQLGARNVSVVASGFAEVDELGRELQRKVADTAGRYGMRLLGPNSNGFMNVASGGYFAFTPVIDSARPVPGDVAIVTQSAAIGTYLINGCRRIGLGVRNWVHTGNEADVTALELARVLAERGEVRALALCFEVVRDLEGLHDTLKALARAGIAVGVLHAGLSDIGRAASVAHTAALIGAEAKLLGDLFASAGAYAAPSIAGLTNFIQVAVNHPGLPARPRLGFVSTSGGVGVLMADAAEAHGVAMPALSSPVRESIRRYAPFSHPANPVDTTAQVVNEPAAFQRIVESCVDSAELDLVSVLVAHGLAGAHDPTLRQLLAVAERSPDAALAGLGIFSIDAATALQRGGVSVFAEPVDLTSALRAYGDSVEGRARFAYHEWPGPGGDDPESLAVLDEVEAKARLRAAGADVVAGRVAEYADQAVEFAESTGYPVVLKVVSKALPHKAKHGGVRLNLWTAQSVRAAHAELAAVGQQVVGTDFVLLVEQQVSGVELFVGCVRHPHLGPLVGIGPGGSTVEGSGGVRWQWAPVTDAPTTAVADLVAAMLALPGDVRTVETNPVILTVDGRAVVVDALLEEG